MSFVKIIDLSKEVYLKPKFLTNNSNQLKSIIEEQVKYQVIDSCTQSHGYVLDFIKLMGIQKGRINEENTGDVIFKVRYKVKTLKPEVGDKIRAKIIALHEFGIVAQIMIDGKIGPIHIFIQRDSLPEGYEYFNNEYQFKSNSSKTLRLEKLINVKIVYYQFQENKLFYLGNLVS